MAKQEQEIITRDRIMPWRTKEPAPTRAPEEFRDTLCRLRSELDDLFPPERQGTRQQEHYLGGPDAESIMTESASVLYRLGSTADSNEANDVFYVSSRYRRRHKKTDPVKGEVVFVWTNYAGLRYDADTDTYLTYPPIKTSNDLDRFEKIVASHLENARTKPLLEITRMGAVSEPKRRGRPPKQGK